MGQKKEKKELEKYYYDVDTTTHTCKTSCKVYPERKIGSVACKQKCEYRVAYNDRTSWITCKRLDKALGR